MEAYKAAVIQARADTAFCCGVTLHDECLTHFQEGFENSSYLAVSCRC